jgi:hypothetical protein
MKRKKAQPSPVIPKPILVPESSPSPAPVPVADDYAYDLFIEHQKQAWADCQSGSDEFDKSILTYSSAGLGISLVFIKDIVPLAKAVGLMLLYASWVAFGVAILVTVFSFQLSMMAQEKHLEHLRRYYLDRQPEYLNASNKFALWVGHFKWVSGLCFVLAMAGTIVFSIWNLSEAKYMSTNKSNPVTAQDDFGRKPLGMTPLPPSEDRSRTPMRITPMPPAAVPLQPASNAAASTKSKNK